MEKDDILFRPNLTLPWFPEYLSLDTDKGTRTYILHELNGSHNAKYWICDKDESFPIHYDGFRYFKGCYTYYDDIAVKGEEYVDLYPANVFEFLKNNQYGKSYITKHYYVYAWNEILKIDPNAGKQEIKTYGSSIYHKEIYNNPNKFLMWNNIGKPDYFYRYIKFNDQVFVLNKVINENSAYYWLCSGEWGLRIDYMNNVYGYRKMEDHSKCTEIINPIIVNEASAEEFIKANPMFACESSRKYYEIAIQEIKQENWFVNDIKFDNSCNYKYVTCEYNTPIFSNWTL